MKLKHYGFGFIEVLIVVAAFAVLAAIFLPSISRQASKNYQNSIEIMAEHRLEDIVLAEARYYEKYKSYGSFEQLAQTGLIAASLTEYDYRLKTLRSDSKSYAFTATVEKPDPKNKDLRSFFVDQSGVVRGEKGIGASASSPPVVPVK